MAKILLVATVPPYASFPVGTPPVYCSEWIEFAKAAQAQTDATSGARRLSECAWLFDAAGSWPALHAISEAAKAAEVQFTTLLIEGELTELTQTTERRAATVGGLRV